MLKALIGVTVLILLLFAVLIGVNNTGRISSHKYAVDYCTRYCHDNPCPHFEARKSEGKAILVDVQARFYRANILLLRDNVFGIPYAAMNLIVYIFLIPVLILVLLYGLIRKRHGIG